MRYQNTSNAVATATTAAPARRATVTRLPVKRVRTRSKARAKSRVNTKVLAVVGVFVFFVGMWAFNLGTRVSIAEVKAQITECDKQIESLDSNKVTLEMQLESLYSFENIEEKAKSFGMMKSTDAQVKYINSHSKDKAEIVKDDKE